MAQRGGKRPGAGRKPGVARKTTEAIIEDQRARREVMPLSVMLRAMREALHAGDLDKAHNYAKDAAPYVHPKLASTEVKVEDNRDATDMSDAELAAVIAAGSSEGTAEAESGEEAASRVH